MNKTTAARERDEHGDTRGRAKILSQHFEREMLCPDLQSWIWRAQRQEHRGA